MCEEKEKQEIRKRVQREFPGCKALQDIHYYRYVKEIEWQAMSPGEIVEGIKRGASEMKHFKIIVEKHRDGYVAYPVGLNGIVVGEGDTYEEALADVRSAIQFHIETFGQEVLEVESPVLEVFVAEAGVVI
jgi:predicted RNase H-like HicB family nuclease